MIKYSMVTGASRCHRRVSNSSKYLEFDGSYFEVGRVLEPILQTVGQIYPNHYNWSAHRGLIL